MATSNDYCFTCKHEVIATKELKCPHCLKTLWTATATKPDAYVHTLRTRSYATDELLKPCRHEEPLKHETPWKKPEKRKVFDKWVSQRKSHFNC